MLTPSERVVLFPDDFTEAGGLLTSKVELPDGRKLASAGLGEAAMQTAILANEAAGVLRLEVEEGKALFGLMRTRTLRVHRVQAGSWPEGSLEALVEKRVAEGAGDARKLSEAVLGAEHHDPAAALVGQVQLGLANRGLLEAEQDRVLGVFKVTRYTLPETTRQLANEEGVWPATQLLAAARAERAGLWKELERAVRAALAFMTQSSGD